MAKKTGLALYHELAKRYEKQTGKKPTGMKTPDLQAFFKDAKTKKRKKSSSKSSSKAPTSVDWANSFLFWE